MNRVLIVILMFFILLSISGCKKASEDVSEDNIQLEEEDQNTEDIQTAEDTQTVEQDLKELSQELALQMMEGNFEDTYKRCSLVMKMQMTKEALEKAWSATVDGLGNYIDVYEITQKEIDQYQKVNVILQYENNGLAVSFTYNDEKKLDGFWLNYTAIEKEAVSSDAFIEVKITFGEGDYPITGMLTLPKNVENPPVAILVPGSGNHDINEGVKANKPFQDIAWGLAEHGIASIRYNERALLYPELASGEFTIELDSLNDAADAIQYASSCDQVDKDNIFVIGHSLGAMMAPKIASDHKEVAGIVLLAGSPRNLEKIIYDQVKYAIDHTDNITEEQVQEAMASTEEGIAAIQELSDSSSAVILGYPSSYWYSLKQINISELTLGLTIPIYIAQGSEDFQVYSDKDYTQWQELLGDKANVTFKLYDNLNHLFMTANGKTDVTEYNIPGHVDQVVIEDIALYILGK